MRYYEDFETGETQQSGGITLSADDIVRFAERYDPQPFHTDPEAAAESAFGGLIASGWHTAAATMRTLVEDFFDGTAFRGAVGVDELRWKVPVRPGDTLSTESEILDREQWNDDLGLVRAETTVYNQDGDPVMTMVGLLLFERHDAGSE